MSCQAQLLFFIAIFVTLSNRLNGQHHHQYSKQETPVELLNPANPPHKLIVPDLPQRHYQFWLKNHPLHFKEFQEICKKLPHPLHIKTLDYFQDLHKNLTFEEGSPYFKDLEYGRVVLNKICKKINIITKSCWGYENTCQIIHLMPECDGSKLGQSNSEQEQKIAWFSQADFGYILDRRRELGRFCSPDKYSNESVKSSLECTKYFKTCRGENLMMRFASIPRGESLVTMSKQDLIRPGDVGGWNCDLQQKRIREENGQRGPLQSWFAELENYKLLQGVSSTNSCDVIIDKQAFIVKPDSPTNMYHYFCNFLNLYATFHLNNKFNYDNQIIIWDNHLPRSKFNQMWSAFSKNKLMSIDEFEGKRVCFRRFIFTLMPRMVDGLYYNTPLTPGCSKTGLFDAFNKHVLYKLNVKQVYNLDWHKRSDNKQIRVTILTRSTPSRRILNELELQKALQNQSSDYVVQLIDYQNINFLEQLKITHNTDILVGIHGAGLTHTLFLPDWAALFELHDCGDKCYYDLARLRGVSYFTYQNLNKFLKKVPVDDKAELERITKLKLVDNEKFSNFIVSASEFLHDIERAVKQVRESRFKYFKDLEAEFIEEGLILKPRQAPSSSGQTTSTTESTKTVTKPSVEKETLELKQNSAKLKGDLESGPKVTEPHTEL